MSVADQLAAMPDWPALMNAGTAALYLEISEASFLALARRSSLRPVDLGLSVVRWRKVDLDTLVGALPARGAQGQAEGSDDPFETALRRSAVRGRGRRGNATSQGPQS